MADRAVFETASDRRRQAEIAALLAERWRCHLVDLGLLSTVDYRAERDGVTVAFIEIKSRLNRDARTFSDVFLNVEKRTALVAAASRAGCAAIFVWAFRDQIRWIDVRECAFPIEQRGRADRDGMDVREAYRIPVHRTQLLRQQEIGGPLPYAWPGPSGLFAAWERELIDDEDFVQEVE
jgi:hypothetical protein